ncbi:hypothetical protein HZA38_05275 [Candidatus Peregrinibacteria bacterium]|nr:hypothetical protein [Candidatus Peregrinibacteria bacterium]
MITQISFTADEELKNKAMEKAKKEGITLKTLLVYSMRSFVEGEITLHLISTTEEPEVEEIIFDDMQLNEKAKKLTKLLS